jgi:hypothetical protein
MEVSRSVQYHWICLNTLNARIYTLHVVVFDLLIASHVRVCAPIT